MILARSDSIVEGFWSEDVVKRGASERISVPGGMVVLAMSPLPLLGMSERVKRADSAGGVVVEVVVVEGDMLVAVVVSFYDEVGDYLYTSSSRDTKKIELLLGRRH